MNETKREIEAHAAVDAGYEVMTYDTPLDEFPMADNDINGINQIILLVCVHAFELVITSY
jgi:hypothetical protein